MNEEFLTVMEVAETLKLNPQTDGASAHRPECLRRSWHAGTTHESNEESAADGRGGVARIRALT